MKRRLREIVRRNLNQIKPGYDCLFVARPAVLTATHEDIEQAMLELMRRGGLLTGDRKDSGSGGSRQ